MFNLKTNIMRKNLLLFLLVLFYSISAKSQSLDYTRAPNSFIFDPFQNDTDGFYIPVVKAYAMWGDPNGYLNNPISASGVLSASIYWEDVSGLIKSDPSTSALYDLPIVGSGQNAKIKVLIDKAKGEGNAVVALKVDGEIKWTWHVWVTDSPTDGVEYSQGFETDLAGNPFTVKYMDRNLGAINASFLGDDWHKSGGLMYEWGRKDPFPPLVYKDFSYYKISGEVGTIVHRAALNKHVNDVILPVVYRPYDDINSNIKYSVNNPIQYILNPIYSSSGTPINNGEDSWTQLSSGRWVLGVNATWFSKSQYESPTKAWDLWGDNYKGGNSNASSSNTTVANDSKSYELKSPYDPCPNGWRIPSNYGRVTTNNNHSPWGRKNSGGNDDGYTSSIQVNSQAQYDAITTQKASLRDLNGDNVINSSDFPQTVAYNDPSINGGKFYNTVMPNAQNPVLAGIKAYPGLGFDFSAASNRNLGLMPVSGNYENYPNVVVPGNVATNGLGSVVFQDQEADGALWSATYAEGGARHLKLISSLEMDKPDRFDFVVATNVTTPTKDGNAVRCIEDPNIDFLPDFEIETIAAQEDISSYMDWTKDPNTYLIEPLSTSQILEIPVRKAYAMQKLYLSEDGNLPQGSVKTPSVYWTTNTGMIEKLELEGADENAKIKVTLKANQYGNAVVALHIGNNGVFGATQPDPVIWSWHIWSPETVPGEVAYTTESPLPTNNQIVNMTNSSAPPLSTTFMDRNLGALQMMPNEFGHAPELRKPFSKSGGMHYQWGRKDPIPTFTNPGLYDVDGATSSYVIYRQISNGSNNTLTSTNFAQVDKNSYLTNYTKDYSNYSSGITNATPKFEKVKNGIRYSVKNPLTFMYHNEIVGEDYSFGGTKPMSEKVAKVKDWVSDERGLAQDRWGHGTEKSPYDPCPVGWRVPDASYASLSNEWKMKGTSPWYYSKSVYVDDGVTKYGNPQRETSFITTNNSTSLKEYPGINHKASFPTANHHGWVFNNSLYNIGNIPSTGIRGMLGGNNFQNPYGYYPTENYKALTGLWTASPGDHLSGYAIALEIQGFNVSNASLGRMYTGAGHYPQAAMGVRCAKDEPRYNGQQLCPSSTVWDGLAWSNGMPDFNKKVIINGPYTLLSDLEACELEVGANGSLEIPLGFTFTVNGIVINNASPEDFIVASGGNLIQNEDVENKGKITVKRDSQPMKRLDYTLWSSPVDQQNLFGFSPETVNGVTNFPGSTGRIYIYDGTNGYINPNPYTAQAVMNEAVGYLFRSPNNYHATNLTVYQGKFTGTPNNGNVNVATVAASSTSIGNPYPSNINADLLLAANPGISTLYFWNNTGVAGSNYATYTMLGGTAAGGGSQVPDEFISAGQGFLVETTANSVNFDNTMRVGNPAYFFKGEGVEKHRFWLDLNNSENHRYGQILVGYMNGAAKKTNDQINGKLFKYDGSALYTINGGDKLAIQGKSLPFQSSDVVKLGFRAAEAGNFNISLSNFDGLFSEGEVVIYLKDNELNLLHNLMDSAYSFEAKTGEFNERFEVIFENKSTMSTEDLTGSSVEIYTNNQNIIVESKDEKILSVELYDLSGRQIHTNHNVNANTYNFKSNARGVLVVKVESLNSKVTVKKVIIK